MRIAFRINRLTISLGALIFSGALTHAVQAAEAAATPPASAPMVSAPAAASAQVASQPPAAASSVSAPLPLPEDPKGPANNLATLENKMPDSVKEVMKHLDKTTEDVTLDDLNSARQAVAKIEALIEIEKHLAELEKVRDEREKKTSFAGAIPASALQPPMGMAHMAAGGQAPMMMPERVLEISRIMGRNGHYSAVLKLADDKTKTVQAGDHLSDGSRVVAITSTGVELMHGNSHESLHIKNVDTVFGNS